MLLLLQTAVFLILAFINLVDMDLRIDSLRNSLIGKINATNDADKLEKMLAGFDVDTNEPFITPMTRDLYIERTNAGLKSIREGKVHTPDEVRKRLGIRG